MAARSQFEIGSDAAGILIEGARLLAETSPSAAVKVLADALRLQTPGAARAAVRGLLDELAKHDPTIRLDVRRDINRDMQ
jgi:hypothetical protein